MYRLFCGIIAAGFCVNAVFAEDAPPKPKAKKVELKTNKDKASYGIGLNIGSSIKRDGLDLDLELLRRGIQDAIDGKEPLLTDDELRKAFVALQEELRKRKAEERKAAAAENQKEGEAFLAANKKKPGVKTLASGLQYKVVKSGNGATPKATDRVSTHYHGTLISGKVFDSSVKRGVPAEFAVNGVIKGWTEALQKMKVGDKWILYVPSELAYAERGAGDDIGPNAVLIFEIELLEIKK